MRLHTLCFAPQRSSSSAAGEKLAQNKKRRKNYAQNLQAPSHIEAVMYEKSTVPSLTLSTPHRFVVAWPQVIRPGLLKWLAAFCLLGRVGAAAMPSPSSLRFEADAADPPHKPVRSQRVSATPLVPTPSN